MKKKHNKVAKSQNTLPKNELSPKGSPDEAPTSQHVYLDIQVKAHNRGFHYVAVAKTEKGKTIRLEGWASGSQKEVERTVQTRVSKVIADQQKVEARRMANLNVEHSGETTMEISPTTDVVEQELGSESVSQIEVAQIEAAQIEVAQPETIPDEAPQLVQIPITMPTVTYSVMTNNGEKHIQQARIRYTITPK
jgi:hypothetical protein